MNVSEYLVKLLIENEIKHVFGITGTSMIGLFSALGKAEGIEYICPLHEQAASMGADGYSRASGKVGVAVATSGPGTTNLMTGCAGAFADSVPILYLVGVPGHFSSKGDMDIRFFGFQEMDVFGVFSPITKYIATINKPEDVYIEFKKCISIAMSGRKGPVMMLLPEDVLYADIGNGYESSLSAYEVDERKEIEQNTDIAGILKALSNAERPLVLYGAGIHGSNAETEARCLMKTWKCPVVMTYPARDLYDSYDRICAGSIGVFGTRSGNMALQSCDLLLCIGARLDRFVTGNPTQFAKDAKKIIVDIDLSELEKFENIGINVEYTICMDAKRFINRLLLCFEDNKISTRDYSSWIARIQEWKRRYPICTHLYGEELEINPYEFIRVLSHKLDNRDCIISETGLSAAWIGQAFEFKTGQRWYMEFNYSSMGYALPAAIGVSFVHSNRVICIVGDGGLQMSIQELSTLLYYNRNVKVFVICNEGYGLIQKTQDDFKKGHDATDRENNVPLPNVGVIASAYGIKTVDIWTNEDLYKKIEEILGEVGPLLCSVHIPMSKKITPRVQGGRIDNMYPFLSEQEVKQNMSF